MKNTIAQLRTAIDKSNEASEVKEIYISTINSTIESAIKYVTFIAEQKQRLQFAEFDMGKDDLASLNKELSICREAKSKSLADYVDVLNSACTRFGIEQIAPCVQKGNPATYGDWALSLVKEYFVS